jgi:hypothetical protein
LGGTLGGGWSHIRKLGAAKHLKKTRREEDVLDVHLYT